MSKQWRVTPIFPSWEMRGPRHGTQKEKNQNMEGVIRSRPCNQETIQHYLPNSSAKDHILYQKKKEEKRYLGTHPGLVITMRLFNLTNLKY